MNVTVRQTDVLSQVLRKLRERHAGYRVVRVVESFDDEHRRELLDSGSWLGPYDRFSVGWEFELVNEASDNMGPDRLSVSASPVLDVVFADIYPNVFAIEVSWEEWKDPPRQPDLHRTPGIEGATWKLTYFYNASLRDL